MTKAWSSWNWRVLVGVVMALALPTAAHSQDNDPAAETPALAETTIPAEAEATPPVRLANGTSFGGWIVTCEAIAVDETSCVLSQRLVRTSDDTFLAELVAFWNAELDQTFLAAYVPVGVYFPSGFAMRPDGTEDRYDFTWQSCTRERCEALLVLDEAITNALSQAEQTIMGYRPDALADPLVFSTSTAGLVEGLDTLRQALAGRS